ncbi:L-rhamnose mutarotase [Aquimarina algiphila]|uniref:L-rhamnose mutarotase n=1 Tax=Aquimarina algiphila TaxID=2047982 RepID=UPI00232DAC43|nr:L-rhamnose mutarotase [Aquimarina algiphila]
MKKYIAIVLLIFTLCACNQNKGDDGKVRRFTFAVSSSVKLPSNLNINDTSIEIEVFKLNDKAFLIIDAPGNYNFEDVLTTLQKNNSSVFVLLESLSPLERVYKLDQEYEYTPLEGQLISIQENTKKYVLTLEIINDPELKKEYKRVHGKGMAWPEITANMKEVGIKDMEIYWEGYQAYLIMDTKMDFDFATDGEKWSTLPRESEWQEYVAKFQKVDPQSKAAEKWQTMILQK